jgi:hypothetical protein
MTAKTSEPPRGKAGAGPRKDVDDRQVKDLELAGGVEGGMEAGSAGGPSQQDAERSKAQKQAPR